MSARSVAAVATRTLRNSRPSSRAISTSRVVRLPRQGLPRPPLLSVPSTSASTLDSFTIEQSTPDIERDAGASASSSQTPWFLQEEEDLEILTPAVSTTYANSPWSPEFTLPEPLASLHQVLTEGQYSALIARPDGKSGVDNMTGKRPIVYIDAKQHSEDAWTDWIVVVQVKSSAGGSVSRVAKEVGTFLKHVRPPVPPPTLEAAGEGHGGGKEVTSIEDFLGEEPGPSSARRRSSRVEEEDTQSSNTEAEPEKRRWQPFKIISREAQDGIRLLHSTNPEQWSRKMLAETFKISQESVRRILRSKWNPPAQVVGRQNRKAMERQIERRSMQKTWMKQEEEEVSMIRREMERDNEDAEDDEQEYRLQGQEEDEENRYTHPVYYEGLVSTGEDRSHGKGKSATTRGDGEWCLVDAGWCVVHVMTARARNTYDVESIAAQNSDRLELEEAVA
jgi:hypothetical protein